MGATYRRIAVQLGVNERTAYYDIQDALGSLDTVVRQTAERLRDLEAARLDRLNVALAPGIKAALPGAIMAAVRVMERRAKLFGLDAPTPQQVTVHASLPVCRVDGRRAETEADRERGGHRRRGHSMSTGTISTGQPFRAHRARKRRGWIREYQ